MLKFERLDHPGLVFINPSLVEAIHAGVSKLGDKGTAIKLASGAEILVKAEPEQVSHEVTKRLNTLASANRP